MSPDELVSVSFDGTAITIIDQTALPARLEHRRLATIDDLVEAIVTMRVRGAPAIGIAGAYGVALAARAVAAQERGRSCTAADVVRKLRPQIARLRAARPTAVNLAWAVDRVAAALPSSPHESPDAVAVAARAEADAIAREDADACRRMAGHAQAFLARPSRVLTHCNTGLLCTGGIGTALGAIRVGHDAGNVVRVLACETRPLLQGARLTAWELGILGIPHDLIVDGAAAGLVARGDVDVVLVGADRIAANGDTANKVGTYAHALAAQAAGIDFVVVAPTSTIDASTPDGAAIEIEMRAASEVATALGHPTAAEGSPILNPAFDVTPAALITAIVTETGVHRPPYDFSAFR